MYQVIIVLDESKNKSYYYSYVPNDGNIECAELPPYQDIDKARACYWDAKNSAWIYDEEKYQEIIEAKAQAEAEAAARKAEVEATPTLAELSAGLMDVAELASKLEAELAALKAN